MAAPKGLFSRKLTVDVALSSHNCQHAASHRIVKGARRLKIPKGRSWEHYCVECGLGIIQREMLRLKELEDALRGQSGSC